MEAIKPWDGVTYDTTERGSDEKKKSKMSGSRRTYRTLPLDVPHSPAERIALSRRTSRTLPREVPHSVLHSPAERPSKIDADLGQRGHLVSFPEHQVPGNSVSRLGSEGETTRLLTSRAFGIPRLGSPNCSHFQQNEAINHSVTMVTPRDSAPPRAALVTRALFYLRRTRSSVTAPNLITVGDRSSTREYGQRLALNPRVKVLRIYEQVAEERRWTTLAFRRNAEPSIISARAAPSGRWKKLSGPLLLTEVGGAMAPVYPSSPRHGFTLLTSWDPCRHHSLSVPRVVLIRRTSKPRVQRLSRGEGDASSSDLLLQSSAKATAHLRGF
ncbi:hypothetical protein Bbelb_045750 [Branchiostoma belcheri]|nr:hypothetical protein Bbelb_045750 [Branchiostoma belcheri]